MAGVGALAVGVLEEALGVVIQVVVLETGSKGAASRSGGKGWCTHARQCVSVRGMRSMAAWQSMEQSVAEHEVKRKHCVAEQGATRASGDASRGGQRRFFCACVAKLTKFWSQTR